MGDDGQRPGQIRVVPSGNLLRDKYRFVAEDADGNVIATGDEFTSTMVRVGHHRRERTMLNHLISELAVLGWQSVPTGRPWYAHRLYQVGRERLPVAAAAPIEREGLSTGAMWGWTLAIIILLFVVCVVLAYTSEVTFTAS